METPCPFTSINKIKSALAEGARCRVPGVIDGVYGLKELQPFCRLGHGLPTIRSQRPVMTGRHMTGRHRAINNAEYGERLRAAAPFLSNFDLQAHGLCLAGGAASGLLMHDPNGNRAFHDFDLYLVGHKGAAEATLAIEEFKEHIRKQWKEEGHKVEVFRTQGCITFRNAATGVLIQIILRLYTTPGEVIHNFDLGSSAALWDGQTFMTTAIGKIAFEHGANVLDLSMRRCSYERRIARYFSRGFDLVLPDCGDQTLSIKDMPYLRVDDCTVRCPCHVEADALIATHPTPGQDQGAVSDYAVSDVPYHSRLCIAMRNLEAVSASANDASKPVGLCASADLSRELNIFAIEPRVTSEQLAGLVSNCFAVGTVDIKKLFRLLGNEAALNIVLDSLAKQGDAPPQVIIDRHCRARCREVNQAMNIPFVFMTVEEAISSSQGRGISAREWYGKAWVPI